MKHFFLRAATICSPLFAAALLAVPVHAAPFAVSDPTPLQTFVNAATEYSATFSSGSITIERCALFIDGASQGEMARTGTALNGTARRTASIASAGTHLVQVTCYNDSIGTSASSFEVTVTVSADGNVPMLSAYTLTPPAPVAGSSFTIQSNYDDTDFGSGLNTCKLFVDSVERGLMSLSGGVGSTAGTASLAVTVVSAGSRSLMINCFDRSGNLGTRTQTVVFSAPLDITPPDVSLVVPTTAIKDVATVITANYSDSVGVTSCKLDVDGTSQGSMTLSGIQATKSHTFTSAGNHTVVVNCTDAALNTGSKTITINVSPAAIGDTTDPTVTSVNPASATVGVSTNISASFSDAVGVTACNLYIGGSFIGSMDRSGTTSGTATRNHTFGSAGTYTAEVRCTDAGGNIGSASDAITITVSGTAGIYTNRIVKLACPAGSIDVNHPCKAVYFVGSDGKRHAFPNERVFFTWYSNFDGVIELNSTALSAIVLGGNVNYRPGVRMVKFTTLNKVYAVSRYGTLRWVTTEAIARSLYGTAWNTRIDDIADTFFTDYTFGSDVTPAVSFNPSTETSAVLSIDANLR